MRFPEPGFWLICLVIYGVTTGYLMPRLLAGSTQIVPLGTSLEYAATGSTVPLGPVSSNLTQAIYLIGDVTCFVMIVAIASTQAGFSVIAGACVAYVAANVLFALADIATYSTGTQWLMEPIRNATYTMRVDEEVSGMKRIAGSFTEASAFAGQTLVALGFIGTLWVCGRRPILTGALTLASLALVVLSTSSIGLAGTPPTLMILYMTAIMRRGIDFRRPIASAALLCAPLVVIAVFLALQLNEDAWKPIRDYIDALIFNKVGSEFCGRARLLEHLCTAELLRFLRTGPRPRNRSCFKLSSCTAIQRRTAGDNFLCALCSNSFRTPARCSGYVLL